MDRLTGVAELLDGPLDDPAALDGNLRDLARINRLTGGTRLSARAIDALGDATTILDIGTGAADIPMTLLARAKAAGRPLSITATDSRPEILASARRARPAIDRTAGLDLAVADGRGLPYPDGAFDVAHSSMVVHHLGPDEVVAFLREQRRVARRHAIGTSRYTRHDGPLSVRRAYSRRELRDMVAAAGLAPVAEFAGFAGHRVSIAAR